MDPVVSMASDIEKLTKLGSEKTTYAYDKPDRKMLEVFENPAKETGHSYTITHNTEEFSSLCPKTGQPDFASIHIEFRPRDLCVETKSLKLYLFAFRNQGSFMEAICNQIAYDLAIILQPRKVSVKMSFKSRGGIATHVEVNWYGHDIKKEIARLEKLAKGLEATASNEEDEEWDEDEE